MRLSRESTRTLTSSRMLLCNQSLQGHQEIIKRINFNIGRSLLNPTEVRVQAQEGCYHGPIICNHIKSQFLIPSSSGWIAHGV
ncbi:hypothetical protein MARPO_0313s0002 [Marchantia polymorpha]|uniref:Uncharacterized protein n=1 Tax=Marchantia polymorpha TaxID=3197 RepID=A0A2R6VZ25_MARPO|nr:hypothetical protein MARPO_0313s0002 [Marchantia polymorpha]|eukprot:PTQ26852.1 hypothetical protein MARPO_0313s0002 [Marchantia polymorpha]